jgi:hypothetical protein
LFLCCLGVARDDALKIANSARKSQISSNNAVVAAL